MIELYKISDSSRFATNTESRRRGENRETGFDRVFQGTQPDAKDKIASGRRENADGQGFSSIDDGRSSNVEVVTYTFDGRLSRFSKYSGIILNYEV